MKGVFVKLTRSFLKSMKLLLLLFIFTGLFVSCGEGNSTYVGNSTLSNDNSQITSTYREVRIAKEANLESYLDIDIVFTYDSGKGCYDEAVIYVSSWDSFHIYIGAYVEVFNGITQIGTTKISEAGYSRFTVNCSVHNTSLANQTIRITAN